MSRRELRDSEKIVDLDGVASFLDRSHQQVLKRIYKVRDEWAEELAQLMLEALPKGPLAVETLDLPKDAVLKMARGIEPLLYEQFRYGVRQVMEELNKQGAKIEVLQLRDEPLTVKEIILIVKARALNLAQRMAERILGNFKTEAITSFRTGGADDYSIDDVHRMMTEAFISTERTAGLLARAHVSEAYNMGRDTQAQSATDQIDYCEYSNVLEDGNICRNCKPLDGKRLKLGSKEYYRYMPPLFNCEGRGYCRCFYVYVMKSEGQPT